MVNWPSSKTEIQLKQTARTHTSSSKKSLLAIFSTEIDHKNMVGEYVVDSKLLFISIKRI